VIEGQVGGGGFGMPALDLPNGGAVKSLRAEGGDGEDETLTTGEPGGDAVSYRSPTLSQTALSLDHVVLVGGDGGEGKNQDPFEMGSGGQGVDVRSESAGVALTAVASEILGGAGLGNGDAISVSGKSAAANVTGSTLRSEGALLGAGIVGLSGAQLSLDSVEVGGDRYGALIYEGSMTVRRSRILAGYALSATASGGTSSTAEVIDSLLISTGGTTAESESYDEGSTSTLNLVGSTIVGLAGPAAVRATREEGSGPATVNLRNSIARHLPPPGTPPADLLANGGTIEADFSSFTTTLTENGGTVTAPGSAANIAGDPLFVDPGRGDFAIQGTSPLVDRGNPALAAGGELDLAGSPRSLDGNRDCIAVPDIGAREVTGQGVECDPFPTISGFGVSNRVFAPKGGKGAKRSAMARSSALHKPVKRGTKFSYTLSEPAKVSIVIERKGTRRGKKARFVKVTTLSSEKRSGKQSTPFSGRVRGKPLKPGRYRATIVATDAAGQASAPHRLSFRIIRG
jgi:hypothetical protein